MAPQRALGKDENPVAHHLEYAPARLDQFHVDAREALPQLGLQTGGPRQVVSHAAVLYRHPRGRGHRLLQSEFASRSESEVTCARGRGGVNLGSACPRANRTGDKGGGQGAGGPLAGSGVSGPDGGAC